MIPSAKMVKRDSAPPENMLNMSRMPPLLRLEQLRQLHRIDARHRNVRADAIDDQRARAGTATGASDRRSVRPRRDPSLAKAISFRPGRRSQRFPAPLAGLWLGFGTRPLRAFGLASLDLAAAPRCHLAGRLDLCRATSSTLAAQLLALPPQPDAGARLRRVPCSFTHARSCRRGSPSPAERGHDSLFQLARSTIPAHPVELRAAPRGQPVVSDTNPRLGSAAAAASGRPRSPTLWIAAGTRLLALVAATGGLADAAADAAADALAWRAWSRLPV